MYLRNLVKTDQVTPIIVKYHKSMMTDHSLLEMLCEFLKIAIPRLKTEASALLDESNALLQDIGYNKEFEQRLRFMSQDVVELLEEGDP